jgi:hypothetical protein
MNRFEKLSAGSRGLSPTTFLAQGLFQKHELGGFLVIPALPLAFELDDAQELRIL